MALPTFSPSIRPSPGAQVTPQVNLLQASFGDGYTQASPNGINHVRQQVQLSWSALTQVQLDELVMFFSTQAGHLPSLYTPAGYGAPVKWTCREWSWQAGPPLSFRARLVETFTLAA